MHEIYCVVIWLNISQSVNVHTYELFHTRPSRRYVISQHMSAEQYSGLYRSADVYVMPTRGEGWGMPVAEAMAMGKAVIVTNWSGPADFVNDEVGYLLNYTLSTVGAGNGLGAGNGRGEGGQTPNPNRLHTLSIVCGDGSGGCLVEVYA